MARNFRQIVDRYYTIGIPSRDNSYYTVAAKPLRSADESWSIGTENAFMQKSVCFRFNQDMKIKKLIQGLKKKKYTRGLVAEEYNGKYWCSEQTSYPWRNVSWMSGNLITDVAKIMPCMQRNFSRFYDHPQIFKQRRRHSRRMQFFFKKRENYNWIDLSIFEEPIIIAMKLHVIIGMSIHPRNLKDKAKGDLIYKIDTETKDY